MKEFELQNLKEWELQIVNKYPDLFLKPTPFIELYIEKGFIKKGETVNLRFGFECGEGWKDLIESWANSVILFTELCNKSGKQFKVYPCIIKEKFGELTFQSDIECNDAEIEKMWYNIEKSICRNSLHVCENCGGFGKLKGKSWLKVVCDKCENK